MEAVSSSGTLVNSYRTTGPNIPEDSHLHANKVSNEGTNELPKQLSKLLNVIYLQFNRQRLLITSTKMAE